MTSSGRLFDTLVVPRTATAIYRSGPLMRALALLRRPAVTRGARLDAATTIDRTIRSGGVPELHWQLEAKSFEYVLLCERGAPGDHMGLLADEIAARLAGARIAFTRYDLDAGIETVRHAGGRRSGPQIEPLVQVRRRHAGARLIILGSGESLSRRFDRPETARRLAEMLDAFESPVLLSTVPAERWGWREARFEQAGDRDLRRRRSRNPQGDRSYRRSRGGRPPEPAHCRRRGRSSRLATPQCGPLRIRPSTAGHGGRLAGAPASRLSGRCRRIPAFRRGRRFPAHRAGDHREACNVGRPAPAPARLGAGEQTRQPAMAPGRPDPGLASPRHPARSVAGRERADPGRSQAAPRRTQGKGGERGDRDRRRGRAPRDHEPGRSPRTAPVPGRARRAGGVGRGHLHPLPRRRSARRARPARHGGARSAEPRPDRGDRRARGSGGDRGVGGAGSASEPAARGWRSGVFRRHGRLSASGMVPLVAAHGPGRERGRAGVQIFTSASMRRLRCSSRREARMPDCSWVCSPASHCFIFS